MTVRALVLVSLLAAIVVGCSSKEPAPTAADKAAPTTAAGTSPSAASTTAVGAAGPAGHDGDRAMAHIVELATNIGPRVAGSDAEKSAAEYIAAQFKNDGFDVETMDFTFEGDRFKPGALTVAGKSFEVTTAANSAGGTVTGPAVFVGLGDAAGIAGRSLVGMIAVADRGTLTFGDKATNVAAAGAVALVIVNNQAGGVSATLAAKAAIPVVGASGDDSSALHAAAQGGASMTVTANAGGVTLAHNVIARPKPGASCTVLVGGHYDTVVSAPGANDNASGTANVLELARAFAADGIDDGLCFVAFSGEESGLFGSAALAALLQREGRLPKLMVNLDVTGIGDLVDVIGDRGFVTETLDLARGLGIPAQAAELPPNTGSDHLSFQKVGVPVLYFESGEFSTIHSPLDVTKDIQEAELDRVGDLAYAAIKQLLPQVARG
jgi:aminopeptidase YwaD